VSRWVVGQDDPGSTAALALIERHLAFAARANSPPEDVHALVVTGLRDRDVTFFGIRNGDEFVCMGALKELEEGQRRDHVRPRTGAVRSSRVRRLRALRGYGASVNSVCMTLELERSDESPRGRRR
jgi:hypothetical protein